MGLGFTGLGGLGFKGLSKRGLGVMEVKRDIGLVGFRGPRDYSRA